MIVKHSQNPIIVPKDVVPSTPQMEVLGVFNCGVTEYDGKTVLLLRVAEKATANDKIARVPVYSKQKNSIIIQEFDRLDKNIDFEDVRFVKTKSQLYLTSISHIRLATSTDRVNFKIADKPLIIADNEYEEFGVEDPRITFIDNYYYINYSAISRRGVVTALARTKDFVNVEKLGIIFTADNKDVAIFPEKINGKYYALHRPVSAYFAKPEMWISYSQDLLAYGGHQFLAGLRHDNFDSSRLGASCVPFLTSQGWLEIYHGCNSNNEYYLGALLLDKTDPTQIIARSNKPLFVADAGYEIIGFMPKVIFTCGCNIEGDKIHLYYGACDETICYGTMSINEVLDSLTRE